MFYCLTGKIIKLDISAVVIECGGVGFYCNTSINSISYLAGEDTATLYTYLNVREDALDLFGFCDEYELEWFKMLISVNGVGPKAALAILSEFTPDRLALSISSGDAKAITRTPGIGPKIAQRIILDLKDKVGSAVSKSSSVAEDFARVSAVQEMPAASEAVAALTMLGYSQSEASVAVSKIDPGLSVENIIKQALKLLSTQ